MTLDLQMFLAGRSQHPDTGLKFEDIEGVPHEEFERYHTLIQWLFPTMTPSKKQPDSPFLEADDVKLFRVDQQVQKNIKAATRYMIGFYEGGVGGPLLMSHRNHNHLRVTRIIESLSLLVGLDKAEAFYTLMMSMNAKAGWPVNMETIDYWKTARHYGPQKMSWRYK